MSKKPKTRIITIINGIEREILSIHEQKDYSLVILPKQGRNYEHIEYGDVPFKDMHYSVHNSYKSKKSGTTIKLTIELENSEIREISSFIKGKKEDLLWPVFSARLMDMSSEKFNTKQRAKDKLICIAEFTKEYASLFISIFVSAKGKNYRQLIHSSINISVVDFEIYSIHIFSSYVPLPPSISSKMIIMTTSPEKINNILSTSPFGDGCQSIDPLKLENVISKMKLLVTKNTVLHMKDQTNNDPEELACLELLASIYSAQPLYS